MELTEQDIVDLAKDCMTDRQFTVWRLRRDGYTFYEIREEIGAHVSTLCREYSRGLAKLEKAIYEAEGVKDRYGVTIAFGKHTRFGSDTTLLRVRKTGYLVPENMEELQMQ